MERLVRRGAVLLVGFLLSGVLAVQVSVPFTEVKTALFASVTLRCDYSTSATLQNVIVTWSYKSFCKDPVLEYYSTAYQAALQLGQDPSNDCPDRQRTVKIVAQKQGTNAATLGPEYSQRKITIQNKADLVISEVMWWDNGVYYCSIGAVGDMTGDGDKFVKLVVYHWLTVLFIVIGALLLIILFGICCCQCCPQRCCCYIRCPCCPRTCCCPEKAVMQHRMMKDAQQAMSAWANGQQIYAPMSNHSSSYQMNPMLYGGSASGKMPLTPMPLPPPQPMMMPPPSIHGNGSVHGSMHGTNQVLDFLEGQVRGMDMAGPIIQPQPLMQHLPPPPQRMPQNVPFSAGPPSMLSALGDGPNVRRPQGTRPPSGSSGYGRHYPPPSGRNMTRSYSQEDMLDNQSHAGGPGYRPRSRSREDLLVEPRRPGPSRNDRNYSPQRRRGSWGSASDEDSRRGGSRGGRGGDWSDHPPSYREYEPGQKPMKRPEHFSERSSRSGTSIVI